MQPAFTFPAQHYFQVFHVTSKSYSKVLRVPSHGLQISLICRPWLRILKKNEDEVLGLKVWTICVMWPITTIGITELSKTLGHDNRMKESNWWPLVLCIGWVYKLGLKIIFGRWPDMITEQRNFCSVKSLFQNGQNTRETMGKKWTNPCVIFYYWTWLYFYKETKSKIYRWVFGCVCVTGRHDRRVELLAGQDAILADIVHCILSPV